MVDRERLATGRQATALLALLGVLAGCSTSTLPAREPAPTPEPPAATASATSEPRSLAPATPAPGSPPGRSAAASPPACRDAGPGCEPGAPAASARPASEPPPGDSAAASAASAASATEASASAAPPDDVERATMRIRGMKVDGVALSNVLCRPEGGLGGGLLGSLTIGVGFKERRARLDACSPGKEVETRVRWTAAGGRMTKVTAVGPDARVSRCVERALAGATAVIGGECAATVQHGKP